MKLTDKQLEELFVISMKDNIEKLGMSRVLEIIERFSDPLVRLSYRKLYYKALGL